MFLKLCCDSWNFFTCIMHESMRNFPKAASIECTHVKFGTTDSPSDRGESYRLWNRPNLKFFKSPSSEAAREGARQPHTQHWKLREYHESHTLIKTKNQHQNICEPPGHDERRARSCPSNSTDPSAPTHKTGPPASPNQLPLSIPLHPPPPPSWQRPPTIVDTRLTDKSSPRRAG
jgi:hypothetical protein